MFAGVSADTVAAYTGLLALIGGGIASAAGLYIRAIDRAHKAEGALAKTRMNGLEKRLETDEQKRELLERRVADIERTYISRAEHAEFRAEMMSMTQGALAQITKSIDGLGARFEHLVERMARVEAKE